MKIQNVDQPIHDCLVEWGFTRTGDTSFEVKNDGIKKLYARYSVEDLFYIYVIGNQWVVTLEEHVGLTAYGEDGPEALHRFLLGVVGVSDVVH
jgi:hypothetical protein